MDYVPIVLGASLLFFQAYFWGMRILDVFRMMLIVPEIDPDQEGDLPRDAPLISVIVPANNEQDGIQECLESVLNQNYPRFEVILVDDRSEDLTASRARSLAQGRDNFSIISVRELPPGWTGKCHACTVGVKRAAGEWLAFLDADSRLHPNALAACYRAAVERGVSMVTVSPGLVLRTFWEKALQPVFLGMASLLFPPSQVNDPTSDVAAANGMFYLISRRAYEDIGGHAAVRNLAVEDIGIGKRVKPQGLGLMFANGRKILQTRMYSRLTDILQGWTRILAAAMNYEIAGVCKQFAIHFSISAPALVAGIYLYFPALSVLGPKVWAAPLAVITLELLILLMFFCPLLGTPRRYALLIPLGNLALVVVLAVIVKKILLREALQWRGTTYHATLYQPKLLDPAASQASNATVTDIPRR
ncbi:MAG: glycosyltransferase family 2 protein [Desulfomonile sp.]|nr:glycosyltransferase family 2 protein [Desulfomonile sp.]